MGCCSTRPTAFARRPSARVISADVVEIADGRGPERVAFDDAENAFAEVPRCRCTGFSTDLLLPATSLTRVRDASAYPFVSNGAAGGWMYLNLDNDPLDHFASSNWVISSLRAEGRYSADIEAASLGNGCSAPAAQSEISSGLTTIGPRP